MKVLIIYYSQSGNTMLIARHIEKGLRRAGADVTVVKLKDATYEMMADYDLIGLGSPVWKADTPNMHHFIDRMPDQTTKPRGFYRDPEPEEPWSDAHRLQRLVR